MAKRNDQRPGPRRCASAWERRLRAEGFRYVAGVDEAGRGSLFGPVVAAAVILNPDDPVPGLRDSKLLAASERSRLAELIRRRALAWAIAEAGADEIDRMNILEASRVAMLRALLALDPPAEFALVDAVRLDTMLPQRALIHGDARERSIAAASILAKVARDELMEQWAMLFPEYGLDRHKGYATREHLEALAHYGPSPLHRFSYRPVREADLFCRAVPAALRQPVLPFDAGIAGGTS